MYSDLLQQMWDMVFPNSLIGALAILVFFAYFCFKKNLGIPETFIVMFPVIIGVSTTGCFNTTVSGCLPIWFTGAFVMGVGLVWGIALAKAISPYSPAFKFYGIILCMNAALMIYGYHLAPYTYSTSGQTVNLFNVSSTFTGSDLGGLLASPLAVISSITSAYSFLFDFLLGSGISGFFLVSGIPFAEYWAVPLQIIGFLLFIPILLDLGNFIVNAAKTIISIIPH